MPTDRPLEFFLDRSLGRIVVPRLLRAAGLTVLTLAERYGVPADEKVSDERWITDAGKRDEVVLMKDTRVRYNQAEKAAIIRHGVRCFCLSSGGLDGADMARRFFANMPKIASACAEPGPYVYSVQQNRIVKLEL